MRVKWARPALLDISRIYDYVAQFNPATAARLAARLDEAAVELERFPHRGRQTGRPNRRELTIVSPYILTYEVRGDAEIATGDQIAQRMNDFHEKVTATFSDLEQQIIHK